ncbi:hypothetical protein H4O20_13525 [Aequorivita sp. 609]|uniref:hypothetical protein n=1 Tax=Aequorivita TaxID=153265 RepID=UPI001614FDD5|nr:MULTISPECIES: hypothetical protein [Aequorivita]MBB6682465.1 hypothetical protein [Aequorivita sp. 609]
MRITIILIILILASGFTFLDIAPNPIDAKGIYTKEECKIQMQSEVVEVDIYDGYSIVNCKFSMLNKGEETSLEIGFPEMNFQYWSIGGYEETDKSKFEITVDNNKLTSNDIKVPEELEELYQEFMNISKMEREYINLKDSIYSSYNIKERKDGSKIYKNPDDFKQVTTIIDSLSTLHFNNTAHSSSLYSQFDEKVRNGVFPWYVWDVNFKENERKEITVSYRMPIGLGYGGKYRYFSYLLNTGKGWYEEIENAKVILNLHDVPLENIEKIEPKGYKFDESDKVISWEFKNLEPTEEDDIYLEFFIKKERKQFERYMKKKRRKINRN